MGADADARCFFIAGRTVPFAARVDGSDITMRHFGHSIVSELGGYDNNASQWLFSSE
jgi:hypothetical protein